MNDQALEMITFIKDEVIRNPRISLDEETAIVSGGLIDSMALVEILAKLEDVTGLRIPAGKVKPADMDTVARMFATAARVGKPRQRSLNGKN